MDTIEAAQRSGYRPRSWIPLRECDGDIGRRLLHPSDKDIAWPIDPDAASPRRATFRPSARARLPVRHRDVGALLLLRDARAARALHGEIPAAARATPTTSSGLRRCAACFEGMFGPLAAQPFASHIYGLYTGLVYLTPFFGGLIADRVLGQHRTIVIGAVADGDRPFHDGVRAAVPVRAARAHPRQRLLQAQHVDPGRHALSRPATRGATAPTRSSMSASISARSWRRSSAARSARRSAGTTASAPPASA